jgi:iron complex outermembrane receptor protein
MCRELRLQIFLRGIAPVWLALATGGLFGATPAADHSRRTYELPAGEAATTLRQFSEISGREILFAAEIVRGVRTNAVRGEFTPLEAAKHMLAGTKLAATQDDKTGALAVHREKQPALPPPQRSG